MEVPVLAVVLLVALLTVATPTAQARVESRPASALPLAGRVIAIDPGHQLGNSRHPREIRRQVYVGLWKDCNTTGTATNAGLPEATFAWRTSLALARRLSALGATVRLSRQSNSLTAWGPCVDARGRFGAAVGADLEISLHGDGAPPATHGFFVIRPGVRLGWTDDIALPSAVLAKDIRDELVAAGVSVSTAYGGDGLDVRRDLGTLNAADVPTVVVELGNMRNAGDARCMTSPVCRDGYSRGLAQGVRRYLAR